MDEQIALEEIGSPISSMSAGSRKVKCFRIKYFEVLAGEISQNIAQIYSENKDDLATMLEAIDGIIDILTLVHDELVPIFPKRYSIFHFFVLEYHRGIYQLVSQMTQGELDPAVILLLIRWVGDYYHNMSSRLDVSEDLLEPRLLDGREEEMLEIYSRLVRKKLTEWLSNIISTETIDFLERKVPPDVDSGDQYLLRGSVIVFQMFNQQIDVVAQSSRGQLLNDVVVECCKSLEEFQNAWMKLLELESAKFTNKANDLAEGLVEYVLALANDCMRSAEFSETIIGRLNELSDDCSKEKIAQNVKTSQEGFMKIARLCVQILIDIVMSDLTPAFKVMHCETWYEQDVMKLIIGTLDDYSQDFRKHSCEYIFNKIASELVDRFIIGYLETLKAKAAKFKMPTAIERMKTDLEAAVLFFSKSKNAKRVKTNFEILEKVLGILEANPRMIYLDCYSLWKAYPDVPLDFLEKLLSKRDDLDKSQLRDILETCRNKLKDDKLDVTALASYFSKMK
jgi:hypothetical protein